MRAAVLRPIAFLLVCLASVATGCRTQAEIFTPAPSYMAYPSVFVESHEASGAEAFARLKTWAAGPAIAPDESITEADSSSGRMVIEGAVRSLVSGGVTESVSYRLAVRVGDRAIRIEQTMERDATRVVSVEIQARMDALAEGAVRAVRGE
ncbi:MAG: hypothetical protein AAF791_02890 [Bacteroidota bacterium]